VTMGDLTLALNGVYFDQVRSGEKREEFRLQTPYWRKRLEGRTYENVVLTRGYPAAADLSRRLTIPWRGFREVTITHPHFGPDPVFVFAINVSGRQSLQEQPTNGGRDDG